MFNKWHARHDSRLITDQFFFMFIHGRYRTMAQVPDTSFIPNMPNGPLDEYRKRAKFDWKQLRLIFENESLLRLKYKTWNKIESDPLFAKPRCTKSSDEAKHRAALQMNATNLLKLAPPDVESMSHRQKVCTLSNCKDWENLPI